MKIQDGFIVEEGQEPRKFDPTNMRDCVFIARSAVTIKHGVGIFEPIEINNNLIESVSHDKFRVFVHGLNTGRIPMPYLQSVAIESPQNAMSILENLSPQEVTLSRACEYESYSTQKKIVVTLVPVHPKPFENTVGDAVLLYRPDLREELTTFVSVSEESIGMTPFELVYGSAIQLLNSIPGARVQLVKALQHVFIIQDNTNFIHSNFIHFYVPIVLEGDIEDLFVSIDMTGDESRSRSNIIHGLMLSEYVDSKTGMGTAISLKPSS